VGAAIATAAALVEAATVAGVAEASSGAKVITEALIGCTLASLPMLSRYDPEAPTVLVLDTRVLRLDGSGGLPTWAGLVAGASIAIIAMLFREELGVDGA